MSATIAVTIGGQVIGVPPMALDWGEKYPRLVELIDWYRSLKVLGQEDLATVDELAKLREFIAEVCKAAGASEETAAGAAGGDLVEVGKVYAALRGVVPADPTASGSG